MSTMKFIYCNMKDKDATLYAREEYVDLTAGCRFGDSGAPQECYTNDVGRLFRSCQREFGRCTGKVYIDKATGDQSIHIGWCFLKRVEYDHGKGSTYLREVWVTLYTAVE